MTKAVELSVYIYVGGFLCLISLSLVYNGIVVCPLWKSTPSLASAADAMT